MADTSKYQLKTREDELVALGVLLLRRLSDSQSALARDLKEVGFGVTRIAQLLGTTPNTVNQAVQKGKRAQRKSVKKAKRG